MAEPTIEGRRQRRFILMTSDPAFRVSVEETIPEGWSMQVVTDLADVGEWNDILLHRFIILDSDDPGIDAVDTVVRLRTDLMLQVAVFSFGGSVGQRDELRLARADRFYERSQVGQVLPQFFAQYGW
ncbi:MAG: hypothetical protein ACYDDA_00625 [Acidiferrobacteraceae bacterium]